MSRARPPRAGTAWWRLWSVQGGFEPSGQQWSGWLVCMAPWLRTRLDRAELARWVEDEPATLNTNPYFFGLLVGVRQRIEEERGAEFGRRVTAGLQSALGALGDGLSWSAWRPAFALAAAVAGLIGGVVGLVAVWLCFATAQAWLRNWGLHWGWRAGIGASEELGRLDLRTWTRRGRVLGTTLAAALAVVVAGEWAVRPLAAPGTLGAVAAAGVGAVVSWRRGRGEWALTGTAALVWLLVRAGVVAG